MKLANKLLFKLQLNIETHSRISKDGGGLFSARKILLEFDLGSLAPQISKS